MMTIQSGKLAAFEKRSSETEWPELAAAKPTDISALESELEDYVANDGIALALTPSPRKATSDAMDGQVYTINGVKICFPFKAYPSQIQLMDKLIRTLNMEKTHALLESPTGSGKSLSILCAALAWLEVQKAKSAEYHAKRKVESDEQNGLQPQVLIHDEENLANASDDFDPDFESDRKRIKQTCSSKNKTSCGNCGDSMEPSKELEIDKKEPEIPVIYFASRTHKQLAQLIRELRRTKYTPNFTVLASRSQYCINKNVVKQRDINEACKDSMKDPDRQKRCIFGIRIKKMLEKSSAFVTNMNIEELTAFGKTNRVCPYFLAREATTHSEIIFTPYNYLIDPVIRKAMNIKLDNAVVIIDEAHNIEDTCRDAGSFEVGHDMLSVIQSELSLLLMNPKKRVEYRTEHQEQLSVITILHSWLQKTSPSTSSAATSFKDFEANIDIWEGDGVTAELAGLGFTFEAVKRWKISLESIESKANELMARETMGNGGAGPDGTETTLSSGACRVLQGIWYIYRVRITVQGLYIALINVLENTKRHIEAFRMVRYENYKFGNIVVCTNALIVKDVQKRRRVEYVLGFWCLSPDVTFSLLANEMDSFASELRVDFQNKLEAMHVIGPSQIWAGTFPIGPTGTQLIGNYRTMDTFDYQDDIAKAILQFCRTVPFGVLCFVPSYAFMDKLLKRMDMTGVAHEISRIKNVFIEPKQGNVKDFDKLIKNYYASIVNVQGSKFKDGITGSLLFAVFRGKVSEGLDFIDDNARAVIAIGIPFPSFRDRKVTLKKEYNDRHMYGKKLLSGSQWYDIQAFRALNQALGRCIRHRNDWGAIIFLDQRFLHEGNIAQLSKWVRPNLRKFHGFEAGIESLGSFIHDNSK